MEKRASFWSAVFAVIAIALSAVRFVADLASLPDGFRSMLIVVQAIPIEWAGVILTVGLVAGLAYLLWLALQAAGKGVESLTRWVIKRWFPPLPPIGAGEIQMLIWEADQMLGPKSWMNARPATAPRTPDEMLAQMAPMLYRLKANGIDLHYPLPGEDGQRRLSVVVAQLKAIHPWIADGRVDIARSVAAQNLAQLSAQAAGSKS